MYKECNETDPSIEDCWEFDDYAQRVLVGTLCICISLSGIFGNSLVIFAVYVSRKLRNPTNVFVVNLAVADLVTCFFIIPNVIALLAKDEWPFAPWICSTSAAILMTCVGVSLYTLGAISVNRFILITKTVTDYQKIYGPKRNVVAWLIVVWIVPVLIVNVPIILEVGAVGFNEKYHSCSDLSATEHEHLYDLIIGLGLFPIPLVTVVVCYIRIYLHVIRHAQKLATREDSEVLSTSPNNQSMKIEENGITNPSATSSDSKASQAVTPSVKRKTFMSQRSTTSSGRRTRRQRSIKTYLSKRQIEITKNLFYVLCAFLICIIPYLFVLLLDDKEGAQFVPYAATILMFNSCINWVIYATKHPYFKNIFKSILLCRWKAIPEPIDMIRDRRLPCMKKH